MKREGWKYARRGAVIKANTDAVGAERRSGGGGGEVGRSRRRRRRITNKRRRSKGKPPIFRLGKGGIDL